jgi:hypothetical protein
MCKVVAIDYCRLLGVRREDRASDVPRPARRDAILATAHAGSGGSHVWHRAHSPEPR